METIQNMYQLCNPRLVWGLTLQPEADNLNLPEKI